MEELNTDILDMLDEAVYISDDENRLRYINSAAQILTGYSDAEVRFKKVEEIFALIERPRKHFDCPDSSSPICLNPPVYAQVGNVSSLKLGGERLRLVVLKKGSTEFLEKEDETCTGRHSIPPDTRLFDDGPVVRYQLKIAPQLSVISISENVKQYGYDAKSIINGDIPFSNIFRCQEIARLQRSTGNTEKILATLNDQECLLITALGQKVWVYHHVKVVCQTNGVAEIHGYFIDIRKRKEIEKRYEENHARYLEAQKYARLGHWEYFPEKDLFAASIEACRIYGYSHEDFGDYIPAEKIRNLIHPEDKEEVIKAFRHAGNGTGNGVFSLEHRTRSMDGQFLYLITRGTVKKSSNGEITKYFGTVQDITETKRASEKVRRSRDMLDKIINTIPQAVFWKDNNGVFLGCNNVFARTLGFESHRDLVGLTDYDLMSPRDLAENYRRDDQAVMHSGESLSLVEKVYNGDGEERWVDTTKSPLTDEKGHNIGILGVFDDITDKKQMAEALEKRIASLTTPLDSADKISFEDLFSLEEIQEFQEVFSQATGVGCMIINPSGEPITEPSNVSRFCFDMIRSSKIGNYCKKSEADLVQSHGDKPTVSICQLGGCWHAGAVITVGGKPLASWFIGQVRADTMPDIQIEKYAVEIGVDPTEMVAEYRRMPIMSKERFRSVSQALDTFTSYMSKLAYQNVQQARYITGKRKSEKDLAENRDALAESNIKLALALDLAKMGHWEAVFNKKGDGYFIFNDQFYSIYATSTEREGNRMSVRDYTRNFVHPDEYHIVQESVRAFIESDEPDFFYTTEHRIVTRQNEIRHIAVRFKKVDISQQNEIKLIGVNQDITEMKIIEETLLKAKKEAELANKTKSAFLANMSHEIRTPINGLMGMLQLIQDSEPKPEHQEYVEIAIQSCRRLTRLLSDILDISRVEAGKMLIHEESFDLSDNLAALKQLFLPTARSKGIGFLIGKKENVPDMLLGDGVRFQQILSNLIGNAIKFTIKGEVNVIIERLDMGVKEKGVRLFITVADTGIGISDATLKKLFVPFSQEEVRYKHQFGGAGLGLAISKQLVDLMGGSIEVSSSEEHGTVFYISLPFKQPDESEEENNDQPVALMKRKYNVLFAEDDPVSRMVGSQLLRNLGMDVTAVVHGAEVIKCLSKENFDLVVLDIQMPVMDGLDAARAIRAGEAGMKKRLIPLIAMTAYAMVDDENKFYEAGMDGYVRKPVEKNSLLQEISRVIAKGSRKGKGAHAL